MIRVAEREDGLLDLPQLFVQLKEMGFRSVMVEGGASIITSVLTSHLADQFLLTISPRFVGGLRAVKAQERRSTETAMPRLRNMQFQWLAEDLIIRGDLDRPGNGVRYPLASPAAVHSESPDVEHFTPQRGRGEAMMRSGLVFGLLDTSAGDRRSSGRGPVSRV